VLRHLLTSEIHRATVTHCELHDEGSCAIDDELLQAPGMRDDEPGHIRNIADGGRFVSSAIRAERGSGIVWLEGSAARRAAVRDLVVAAAFGMVDDRESAAAARLVFVDAADRQTELRSAVPVQGLAT
jgi:aspartate 1-decarboxylase